MEDHNGNPPEARPPLLVVVFVALDLAALAALWNLTPLIWGPEHCVPN